MTRVDFYVLPDESDAQRVAMACKLAEKAVRAAKKVFIHTDDEQFAQSVDSALWHFREDAFVPHRTSSLPETTTLESGNPSSDNQGQPGGVASPEPVVIGYGCEPEPGHTVLINLSEQVPPFFSRFERTLEIVNQQQETRSSGRSRYSFYQQRGYPLQHYKIQAATG